MSHIVTIQTQIKDVAALRLATKRLKLAEPVYGTAKLFSSEATGWQVQLPKWRYPVVADIDAGSLAFDNYEGRWGDQVELDRLVQSYAIEKASLEARRMGHTVLEQPLEDGMVKLTIQVGGAS
ncbi:DUF1257 domain-containing protein [Bremerella cremea]|uniref:DUF1257 domain-containing protein n=1 Tax=Blastopirellula marina TaxID=124 RepID=A0A2S8G7V7_9BACT|nr:MULTISPECIES: DUF1257 domain-containing protein [Pirellulaceae]PQO40370.1 DUF1257 domain-containing protein [Blastopirellula marina]RCS51952.1 DUF1257 domain-containing protein [Bremerella cremea]